MSNVEVYRPAESQPVPWSDEQLEILKADLGIKNDEHLAYFAQVATHKGLDPFLGEITAVYYGNDMVIQETVEGLRTIAERSGLYGGFRGPQWSADGHTWLDVWLDETNPPAAARYWVIRKDWTEPAEGKARWKSSVQLNRDGTPKQLWKDRPDEMLGKTAEVRALKRAFPKEFARAGIPVRDLSDAQIVTIEARHAGLDDAARHALVAEVTAGRTESTTELTDEETLASRQEIAKRAPARGESGVSSPCSAGDHGNCPGYYKMAHRCYCSCHQARPDAVARTVARGTGNLEARLELLTKDQLETIKYWRRQQGLTKPVGTMSIEERARIVAELDTRGWASPYDLEPPEEDTPSDVVEPGMFDES